MALDKSVNYSRLFLVSPSDNSRGGEFGINTRWPRKYSGGGKRYPRNVTSCCLQDDTAEYRERRLTKRGLLGISSIFSSTDKASVAPPNGRSLNLRGDIASIADGSDVAPTIEEDENVVVKIFEEATQSVVSVLNSEIPVGGQSATSQPGGGVEEGAIQGTGSGFVWDKFGHIITNYHVIVKLDTDTSGRQRTQVGLLGPDGNTTLHSAKILAKDPSRDLAILKIYVDPDRLRPMPIGTSSDLKVGQSCYAIGNPLGLDHTLTTGVVSGLDRDIPAPNGAAIPGAIQTDAAINSGNSGGPLLDSFGRAIGVNTATFTRSGTGSSSGVNFAVPIDTVRKRVPHLILDAMGIRS